MSLISCWNIGVPNPLPLLLFSYYAVTYKQAQFAAQYRGVTATETILDDATLIRIYGTRLPICEKNVGQAKYAFNSVRFV